MSAAALGLVLAGVATTAVNTSYVVQHDGLRRVPDLGAQTSAGRLRSLLNSPRWVAGALLGYCGLGVQIAALALAPAWAVQSVVAAGLTVALGAWACLGDRGARRRQLTAVALLAGGLLAITLAMQRVRPAGTAPITALALYAAAMLALAFAVPRLARPGGQGRAEATAAGTLYGVTTVAIAAAISELSRSLPLAGAVLAIGAACALAGLPRFQRALQDAGPVSAVILMSAATNVSAILGALLLAGVTRPAPLPLAGLLALTAAGALTAFAAPPERRTAGG